MYPSVVSVAEKYEVVFNLDEVYPGLFLPTAYIVSLDKDGLLAHIKQKALSNTIGSFDLELTDVRIRLFEIVESLQIKLIEKKFSPPRRKVKTLETLMEDPEVKKSIQSYVHRHLDELLSAIVKNNFPITWNVERKVLVKDFILEIGEGVLSPKLAFQRTTSEVRYQLQLANGDGPWRIQEKEVLPITNHPAWLYVDQKLYKVKHINGNMVKPFQKRDEVLIPKDKVKTYFQKFIVKVASRVDIDADGFDIVQHDQLQDCALSVVRGIFDDHLVLAVKMQYPNAEFGWNENKTQRTSLKFEEEEVRIIQVKRDFAAEKIYLQKLEQFNLLKGNGNFFTLNDSSENDFQMVEWLIENQKALQEAGFVIESTELDTQKIYLQQAILSLKSDQVNDWFDIKGMVEVGQFTFPFIRLAKYIAKGNRFYPLPNGEFFLIPLEWMNKYKALVQFASSNQEKLRLNKSQFTLLSEIGINKEVELKTDIEAIDFTPSSDLKATLRPYQLEGVKWLVQLYRNDLGACLADDMGLGKTLQTITVLLHAKEEKAKAEEESSENNSQQLNLFAPAEDEGFLNPLNALIVLPASLVFNWASELA